MVAPCRVFPVLRRLHEFQQLAVDGNDVARDVRDRFDPLDERGVEAFRVELPEDAPGETVEVLRSESRELLLMIGKSINTALARTQGKTIGA